MIGCSTQLLITLVSLDSLRDLEADYFDGKVNFHPIESFALHVGIHISTFPGILLLFFKLLYQHSTMGSLRIYRLVGNFLQSTILDWEGILGNVG